MSSKVDSEGEAGDGPRTSVGDELAELFLRFSPEQNAIKGFAGKWTFFRADSASKESISSQFRCLRTYDLLSQEFGTEDQAYTVKFQTFNESEPTNGRARKRSLDGIYESSHLRTSSDLFFSNNTALSEAEKEENVPECVFWRSIALDSENVMRIAPSLPPRPDAQEIEQKYPGWAAHNGPAGVFAFEAFLMQGDDRWSMGALYSLADLSLISHFCIQERLTTIDPSKPMDFDKFNYRSPSGRLQPEPEAWLDARDYRGEMTELIWDEDGEAMRLAPRPANYNPPNPHSTTHRLFLYEDACYAYYPLKLPEIHGEGSKHFGDGARFEMGVLHGKGETFRRLILRYSAAGAAVSMTKEYFKPDGSFEFDRRQSQSVRRSIGSRRVGSSRFDTSNLFARSDNHRAARLKEAFHKAETEPDEVAPSPPKSPQPKTDTGASNVLDSATISRLMDKTTLKKSGV